MDVLVAIQEYDAIRVGRHRLAALIHFDWHAARYGGRLSLGWSYHWVLAIPVFAPIGLAMLFGSPVAEGFSADRLNAFGIFGAVGIGTFSMVAWRMDGKHGVGIPPGP